MTSKEYRALRHSIDRVKGILARVPHSECLTALHHLKVQSFTLLAHAAFEEYLENIVRAAARDAMRELRKSGRISEVLTSLIATEAMAQVDGARPRRKISGSLAGDVKGFAREAVNSFERDIESNHGIRHENQRTLLLPIGIDPEELDLVAFNALDSFGRRRGAIAHRVMIRTEETRSSATSEVETIVRALRSYDLEVMRLRGS